MGILLSGFLGALQACVSVLLVLSYGAGATKYLSFFSEDTVNSVTKLGGNVILPCLLFTEMGKEAKPSQLANYWILAVVTTFFTALSLMYAHVGVCFFKFPNWMYAAAAFPNMLSLPLLLIESLSKTGGIDSLLLGKNDSVEAALARGKTYFLVNGLVGNILRWGLGPYVIRSGQNDQKSSNDNEATENGSQDSERQPLLSDPRPGRHSPLIRAIQGDEPLRTKRAKRLLGEVIEFFNPPLVSAILAIILGLIPLTHKLLFSENGALYASFTQSLTSVGKLYTALQMFALGGKLVSKQAGRAKIWPLCYLFVYRFFLVPAIAGGIVYGLRFRFPNYVVRDPMLDFVLAISNVGPPAITLAAMADMAGLDQGEQGVIATVLLASYVVTPLMSLPVSGLIAVVDKLY